MKMVSKVIGIITLIAAVGFTFAACNDIIEENPPPSNLLTGSVFINGTAEVGQMLWADTTYLVGSGKISYEWKRGEAADSVTSNIIGAYSGTYLLTEADLGKYIAVTVTRSGYTGSILSNQIGPVTATPVASDFYISENLTQTVWNITPVTIRPKEGKSTGKIIIYYNGIIVLPIEAGTYTVTFDVAAAGDWNGAYGLSGGTLTINESDQTPVADDFDIENLIQTAGQVTPVTIEPKTGKSNGNITIYYDGSTFLPSEIGTYAVTFDVAEATGWNAADELDGGTLQINPPVDAQTPVIISPPVGATVTLNASHSLSVEANSPDGGTLSYQWWSSSSNNGIRDIFGATNSTYNPPTDTVGAYFYYVIITNTIADNGDGGKKTASVRSDTVEICIPSPSEIVINPVNMNEWELTAQTVQIYANVNKTFAVTGNYTAYRWYLDGTQEGTSPTYTVNKPVGVYQLVVVVTDNNGESRSGRCWITADSQASALTANIWANSSINDVNDEDWYSFPVTSGTTYYIWWNDRNQGSGKTGNVAVSARYENAATFIFGSGSNTAVDSGWNTPQSFTATQTGTVEIRVVVFNRDSSNAGSYGVVYSTTATRPAYTVTFNLNGGGGAAPAQQVTPGFSIGLPGGNGISRSGYTFGGWSTDSSGTGTNYTGGFVYTPTGNITLYARWYRNYTVIFNLNGATSGTVPTQSVSPGSGTTLPSGSYISMSGYTFGGWNTLANGTGTNYDAGAAYTPTGDIVFYAQWHRNYTVTFNINNGTGTTPATQTGSAVSGITLPGGSGISRSGYTFGGWNTLANGTGTNYDAGSVYIPTGTITLYARWHLNYTVTYDINGGSGTTPATQSVSPGSGITLPSGSGVARANYTFGGWNTNANGTGTNYDAGAAYTPTGDIIFYAQWSLITVPLSADQWADGTFTAADGETWYSFPVTRGMTYRVWWNDKGQGDGTKTGTVAVGARYAGSTSWIFGGYYYDARSGWITPQSFTADQTGTVEIRVLPINRNSQNIGSYSIVYSTDTTRPSGFTSLAANVWANSSLSSATSEVWFSFSVTSGTTYRIWWNDKGQGNGTKTGDIAVSAGYVGSSGWIFGGTNTTVDSGWTTARSFTASQTGTVEIRVIPFGRNANNIGTYGLVYSTSAARPTP